MADGILKGNEIINGKSKKRKQALKAAEKYSPDLSEKVRVVINSKTTIYVSKEKINSSSIEKIIEDYKKRCKIL